MAEVLHHEPRLPKRHRLPLQPPGRSCPRQIISRCSDVCKHSVELPHLFLLIISLTRCDLRRPWPFLSHAPLHFVAEEEDEGKKVTKDVKYDVERWRRLSLSLTLLELRNEDDYCGSRPRTERWRL
ncbi:unnamed protein product [Musa acuminata subsp. burmannicoides]